MTSSQSISEFADVLCRCDNCNHVCDIADLNEARDLESRVDASGEEPAGECWKCGALSYGISVNHIGHKWFVRRLGSRRGDGTVFAALVRLTSPGHEETYRGYIPYYATNGKEAA